MRFANSANECSHRIYSRRLSFALQFVSDFFWQNQRAQITQRITHSPSCKLKEKTSIHYMRSFHWLDEYNIIITIEKTIARTANYFIFY